ncbi:short-chain collagen C4-like [Mya arenaria]|uniref:short-chain collagen C4-like n=1 Tax=Mya arenaria TaxID=6604 RepID=UPI0022E7D6FA|nr:short-chain collagen C4-like [Mya arenaria]
MRVLTYIFLSVVLCMGLGHGDYIVHDHHEDNYGALINFIINNYKYNETISELISKVQSLERQMAQLLSSTASSGTGFTYVRWGRTTCPGNGSELLYAGYMAGLYFVPPTTTQNQEAGRGGNYLCLPYNPSWNYYSDKENGNLKLTGVEYGMYAHLSDISNFFGSNIRGQQAPCSVCRSLRSQVMIPGRSGCYDGWTMEYSGYLVYAQPDYNEGTEFVCLDLRPEHAGGSTNYEAKNRIFLVEANSEFGLDDSYPNGREIACVICSI